MNEGKTRPLFGKIFSTHVVIIMFFLSIKLYMNSFPFVSTVVKPLPSYPQQEFSLQKKQNRS